jgi:hypothetical protein
MSALNPAISFDGGSFPSSAPLVEGGSIAPFWFDCAIDSVVASTEAFAGDTLIDDFINYTTADATVTTNRKITPLIEVNDGCGCENISFTYSSSNEAVATIDSTGLTSWVSNGTVNITVSAFRFEEFLVSRIFSVTVNRTAGTTTNVKQKFIANTLGAEMTREMAEEIGSLTANNSTKLVFSTQNHGAATYVRSSTCWAKNFDWTGVSPWNSGLANRKAGTLVSPCHLICAKHYQLNIGNSIRFITADNAVVTRTIASKGSVGSTDLTVCKLNEDVPETIKHYKVLDMQSEAFIAKVSDTGFLPIVFFDQEEKALVGNYNLSGVNTNFFGMTRWRYRNQPFYPSHYEKFYEFYETPIGGDSGNPLFFIIDDEPVLQSVFWTSGGGGSISFYKTQVNNIMTSLGGGYQLELYDISSYPNYDSL